MRLEGGKACKNGGWLHRMTEKPDFQKKKAPATSCRSKPVDIDFWALTLKYIDNLSDDNCQKLADKLGFISTSTLHRLGTGWDGKNYTFPMFDGRNRCTGIRLRTEAGKKFSVTGSQNGLFWPGLVVAKSKETLYIAEGPTDTGALIEMGFEAIGRPSCSGGTEFIKELLKDRNREVVIVADRDSPKTAPDGRQFNPGLDGADRLAKAIKSLCRSVRLIKPIGCKDIREWKNKGATREIVLAVVKNARFL
jgi:phage/plasmid primase-like uncharacterized protein